MQVDDAGKGWLEGEDVMIALRGVNSRLTEAEEEYLYRVSNNFTGTDFLVLHRIAMFSLNVFIANTKQGVGPQVFPTLVTALPLQYTYKALHRQWRTYLSRDMRFPTMRYVRPAKAQTSLRIRTV